MPGGGCSRVRLHAAAHPRPLRQVVLPGDGLPGGHLQRDRLLRLPDVRLARLAQHHEDVRRRGPRRHGRHRGPRRQDGRHLPRAGTVREVRTRFIRLNTI